MIRFWPMLICLVALAVPAQQKGSSGSSAGAGAGSKPVSPPRASGYNQPAYMNGAPYNPAYNFPGTSEQQMDPMLERLRRQERQKQVKRDTDRLVRLTSEYQAELQATGPTSATDKHLKEIEKLAHNVRASLLQ